MATSRPNLELVETARDRITIVADFPGLSPGVLFDYWTNPDQLKKWWPPAAELQPMLGGTYYFSWPKQNWASSRQVYHLRSWEDTRLHMEMGSRIHRCYKVTLLFHSIPDGGTKLTLQHEGYSKNSEAKKTRDEHVEGWTFFLRKLQELGPEP